MSFYENHVLPYLLHLACGHEAVDRQRAAVVPEARGRVLEVGMGSGLNLPHYDPRRVELVWGPELIEHAGFGIQRMETGYLPKVPRFAGFNFWGAAAPR